MDEMTEQTLARLREEQKRRKVLAGVLTPEVLEAMEWMLGVKETLFSFEARADGTFDTLMAMRVDTLRGVVATLRFEIGRVDECQAAIEEMEKILCQTKQ